MTWSADDRERLRAAARQAAQWAHAPYSGYRVGAAVLTPKGVIGGANIENASANLGICAERVAIARALMEDAGPIRAVAVIALAGEAGGGPVPDDAVTPCGACRQWLIELAPDADFLPPTGDEVIPVRDLLPRPFRLTATKAEASRPRRPG